MDKLTNTNELIEDLFACPSGNDGWKQFEDVCIKILAFLFVPPLIEPMIQARTYSGIDRRDAVLPNRNLDVHNSWGFIYKELDARMILFEFKNYDIMEIGKDEVNQTANYLKTPMGRLAIMCCNKMPNDAAHIKRNSIYSEHKKVILFMIKDHLKEMLYIKERGEDPADLILDMIERFYIQHE